jgi:hypothetical protein
MRAERQAIGSPAAGAKSARSERKRSSWPFFAPADALEVRRFCPELLSVMGESARSLIFSKRGKAARPALSKRRPLDLDFASNARVRDEVQVQRLRPP